MSKTITPAGAVQVDTKESRLDSTVSPESKKKRGVDDEGYLAAGSLISVSSPCSGTAVAINYISGNEISNQVPIHGAGPLELTTNTQVPFMFVRVRFVEKPGSEVLPPGAPPHIAQDEIQTPHRPTLLTLPPATAGDDSGNPPRIVGP